MRDQLKELIAEHGKAKLNTLTKYPSILTLHKLGEKGRLTDELNIEVNEEMFASEKIDGTNVRIICLGDKYLIGSREFILHHCDDLFFDPSQGIVDGIKSLSPTLVGSSSLSVIYGELFGGRVSSNSKQYGTDRIGFRVFDVAVFGDLSILDMELEDISRWRENKTDEGIVYGQDFLTQKELAILGYNLVPSVPFRLIGTSHQDVLDSMRIAIPETNVPLSEQALMKPEGLVLRNNDRSKIVKIRFEDYERTLRKH